MSVPPLPPLAPLPAAPRARRPHAARLLRALAAALCLAAATSACAAQAALRAQTAQAATSACGDFYAHVNSPWLSRVRIPADRASWGAFQEVEEQNQQVIVASLGNALKGELPPDGSTRRKLLDLYASGMNTAAIERDGLVPMQPVLERIDAMQGRDDLMALLAYLHRLGIGAGFALEVGIDSDDSSRYLPNIGQGGVGLPDRDFYLRTDVEVQALRDRYLEHVARMLEYAGAPRVRAQRMARHVLRIERRLARASMSAVELRDPRAVYNRVTLDELQRQTGGVDWRGYFVAVGVGEHTPINVAQPAFVREFARLAANLAAEEWRSYLRWHALLAYAPFLPRRFEVEHYRFYETELEGRLTRRPRELRVIEAIGGYFGEMAMGQALGSLYVDQAFPSRARERIAAMVENIRGVLRTRIGELNWMSDTTRVEALRKLDAMRVKIGHRDEPVSDAGLEIDSETYAENMMRVAEFELQRRLDRIGRPVDRGEWSMGAHEANAYYDLQLNEIVVPAGVLRPPFFDPDADDAANYGAIGSIIGHEITHAFDDEGRHYDHEGNLRDWWAEEDAARYLALTEPIVRQYGGYVAAGGERIDGRLTLGENIADIGGLKLAYLAYRAAQGAPAGKGEGESDALAADRRFFIAYAASWREKTRRESERLMIATDPHAPTRFRVNGPLRHMPEFARAFACPAGKAAAAGIW